MPKLYLIFNDENRVKRRVNVGEAQFTIGRGAENDLALANQSLSRFHAKIERLGDIFILSDNNSSNGTQLNDNDLTTSIALSDGDKITFGGAVNVKVEISENGANGANINDFDDFGDSDSQKSNVDSMSNTANFNDAPKSENKPNVATPEVKANQASQNPNSRHLIWLAPIGGVFVLLIVTILFFLLSGDGSTTKKARKNDAASESNATRRTKNTEDSTIKANDNNGLTATSDTQNINESQNSTSNVASKSNDANNSSDDVTPVSSGNNELDAVAENSQKFLRNISRESNPILTQKQLALVNAKIKIFKNSAALRDNLKNALKSSSQFQSIASANGLKPQFLSVFALTKLGESRGETLGTANAALPSLKRLSEVLGSELSNDCLLVISANADGNAPNDMRDKLTSSAKQTSNVSVATIRSIWFLHEKGKLSESAFDFAVRFIAIGAIAQNPKAFGIDAENLN